MCREQPDCSSCVEAWVSLTALAAQLQSSLGKKGYAQALSPFRRWKEMEVCGFWPWETTSMLRPDLLLLTRSLHHHTERCWWCLAQLTGWGSTPALLGTPVAGKGPPSQPGWGACVQEAFPTWKSVSPTHTWFLRIPGVPHCLAVKQLCATKEGAHRVLQPTQTAVTPVLPEKTLVCRWGVLCC